MKIMLVNPPSERYIDMEMERDIVEGMGVFPPLGLMYLAAAVETVPGVRVMIVDAPAQKTSLADLGRIMADEQPDLVGVTAMTSSIVDALMVCKLARESVDRTVTVIGGHHASLYPEPTARQPNVDYILAGEAEWAFRDLVRALNRGAEPGPIPGLGRLDRGRNFVFTEPGEVPDLDALPFPDRSLTSGARYTCTLGAYPTLATVMSSRGCPFRCAFCYSPSRHYRLRSAENITAELELIAASGIREVFFFDDLFNIDEKRVLDLCDAMLQRGLKLDWSFRGRVSPLSDRLLAAARQAGCSRIQFGIETGTQQGLDAIDKQVTLEEIQSAVRRTRGHGILAVGSFMIGLPGETREQVFETFRFANSLGLNYIQYAVLLPYPFTKIYDEALKRGIIESDFWRELALDPVGARPGFRLRVWDEIMSEEELQALVRTGYRRFYLRPGFLWSSLVTTRSFNELAKKARGAVTLFKP